MENNYDDKNKATEKAKNLTKIGIEKVKNSIIGKK